MQTCSRIYYSDVFQLLNLFRATHRLSSGAQKLSLQPLVLHTFLVAGRCNEIINSTARLHLVGPFYEFYIAMHGSMNIKHR
jgi:hypothetical protein